MLHFNTVVQVKRFVLLIQPHYLNSDLNGVNQLVDWEAKGILSNLPKNATNTAISADVPAYTAWDNENVTLEDRALSYLDANCSHCHSDDGRASSTGLHLNKDRYTGVVDVKTGVSKVPVVAGNSSGNLNHDIVPGDAAKSIMPTVCTLMIQRLKCQS